MVVVVSVPAWPQLQTQPPEVNSQQARLFTKEDSSKIRTQVRERGTGEKARVKVTLRDKSIVKGYISQVDAESFRVTDKKSGQVRTIAYEDAAKVQKPGLSTGAKIGLGAGIAGGIIVAIIVGSLAESGE
jgi:hypothetical protein